MACDPLTLLIPVENQVRELDAKLLLSCVAVERGYPVVIGSRAFMHYAASSLPRGVYLAKSMRKLSDRMFRILRMLGHEIVAFDEEGLVRLRDDEYHRRRLSAKAMGRSSHLLAWGPDNARAFREFPGYRNTPIHVTGNARTDMMRSELRDYFKPEMEQICDRFGRFVLVNSNFSEVNHFLPGLRVTKQLAEAKGPSGESQYMMDRAHYRVGIYRAFQEMLPKLAEANPDLQIVLRPHPSESHDAWLDLCRDAANVQVVNEGAVLPWIMASTMTISNGCTTSVEARLLGSPSVSYKPLSDEAFDHRVTDDVAHHATSLEHLFSLVRDADAGKLGIRDDEVSRSTLSQHVTATSGRLAAERIIDVLDEAGYASGPLPSPSIAQSAVGHLENSVRTVEKSINTRRPGHRNHWSFYRHRFPELRVDHLEDRVARMAELLDRFRGISVRQIGHELFRVWAR